MSVPLVGSSPPRKEDRRLLTGRSRYISGLVLPGMARLVFVRSAAASADLGPIATDAAARAPGVVAVATGGDDDFRHRQLRAVSALADYVATDQPLLARDRVRFAGEAVAAVVAGTEAQAADAAGLVEVQLTARPAVVDARLASGGASAAPVHDEAADNVIVRRRFHRGDFEAAAARAAVVVRRELSTNRQSAAPIEGRAAVASWDPAEGRLTLHSSTQVPHILRHGLADALQLPESDIRVVTADVGGGFGLKGIVYPEDVAVCVLAMRLGRPVKWVETRTESLQSAAHAREHHYRLAAAFAADGTLLGLGGEVRCNVGAYSVYPWTAGIEPLMAGGLLAGPYRCPVYDVEVLGVATNTAPAGPYRGVARPATTFAVERMLDIGSRELGLEPTDIRRRNLITGADLPYEAATRLVHDSETYDVAFEAVVEAVDWPGHRARQRSARAEGRRLGLGFAVYNELTGLGKRASAGPRMPFRTGHEGMTIRVDPSGTVTALAGVTGQGQGLETTMAQVVADELGVAYDSVRVLTGDTDQSLFGFGAFSSRQGVIGSGAAVTTARRLRAKVVQIAAHLLEANPDDVVVEDGSAHVRGSPAVRVSLERVAQVAYLEPHLLPPDVEPGLEATAFFDPEVGTFAAGALAVEVEVDVETGALTLRRVVCAEDAGRRLHPVIVEGQVHGGLAQGIANAVFEHVRYGPDGQPWTTSLVDYLVPSAAELPSFVTLHVDVPSATNPLGVRGVGEGSTLGPPAAIANAVADALSDLGVEPNALPLSPEAVWRLVSSSGSDRRS